MGWKREGNSMESLTKILLINKSFDAKTSISCSKTSKRRRRRQRRRIRRRKRRGPKTVSKTMDQNGSKKKKNPKREKPSFSFIFCCFFPSENSDCCFCFCMVWLVESWKNILLRHFVVRLTEFCYMSCRGKEWKKFSFFFVLLYWEKIYRNGVEANEVNVAVC